MSYPKSFTGQSNSEILSPENVEIRRLREEVNGLCLQMGEVARYAVPNQPAGARSAMLLAESEKRYRTLFDLSPVAVYVIDHVGVIQDFNRLAAELWGRVPVRGDTDEMFCGAHKLFHPDGSLMPHDSTPMAAVLSGQVDEMRDAEVIIERPDGSRVTVIVNIVPLKSIDGETLGAINCFYDITERFRMEGEIRSQAEELTQLHSRKDEFLAMLSHELRNPLAPITTAIQLLRLQPSATPLQLKTYAIMERQAGQMVRLINELMEVSRISSGKIRLDKQDITINEVVARAVETTQSLVNERQHALTVSLPADTVWLSADADRMEQVVINLISNAAKYSDLGSRIWLSVTLENDMVALRVRDSGMGIGAELLPHIFDLFTQAHRSLDRSRGGLGIGLCLVKRLVEMHDGSITVTSELGHGSEFTVRVPAGQPRWEAASIKTSEADRPLGQAGRILVVDDNVDAADTQGELLTAYGYEVAVAYHGSGVHQRVREFRPHVVLLDIGLPGMDGHEIARSIRCDPALRDVVLVAVTGYGSDADQLKSLEAGFNHHVTKPTDFLRLQDIIEASLSQLA